MSTTINISSIYLGISSFPTMIKYDVVFHTNFVIISTNFNSIKIATKQSNCLQDSKISKFQMTKWELEFGRNTFFLEPISRVAPNTKTPSTSLP